MFQICKKCARVKYAQIRRIIEYKDDKLQQSFCYLKRYLTEAGKIIPRRVTGNCAEHQRMVAKAIKRAREAAIINYVFD